MTTTNAELLYLDHAATGWPKHPAVITAVQQQLASGVGVGRSSYRRASASARLLQQTRDLAARQFASPHNGHWIFAQNGTHALNMALLGLLRPGDHVVTTQAEHNSVLRPLEHLAKHQQVIVTRVPCNNLGHVTIADLLHAIGAQTRLVAITHGSNVTGAIQPIEQLSDALARRPQTERPLLLVDAAQTAGQVPLSLAEVAIDLLAMPGHKALGGPLGTGLLYIGPQAAPEIRSTMFGGTGGQSEALEMPSELPQRLEAGNLDVPAIAGLHAGLEQLQSLDLVKTAAENSRRCHWLADELQTLPGCQVFTAGELPILSLTMPNLLGPHELAALLDSEFGIETRAGLHCAPLIHHALGTAEQGTLRVSFAYHTSDADLEALLKALHEVVK